MRFEVVLERVDGVHLTRGRNSSDEVMVSDVNAAVRTRCQSDGIFEFVALGATVALRTNPRCSFSTGADQRLNNARLMFEVYGGAVSLLQHSFMEVVAVMDVEVPLTEF